jgi:hypothetical protein
MSQICEANHISHFLGFGLWMSRGTRKSRLISKSVRAYANSFPFQLIKTAQVYRVNWLRAKSQAARWEEEHSLLRSEMNWVKNFFQYKQSLCLAWLSSPGSQAAPGHEAYAWRQASMWKLLHSQAATQYTASITKVAASKARYDAERNADL